MDLNHIFLFLAVVSPLLVLARAWRPGGTYRGWRIAALVVLAITGIGWVFSRSAVGYIGGGAWFALLFLPAIGLRKMTEFAARGDYKSARKLGVALQILHPSAELREQVRLFRHLESRQNNQPAIRSVPIGHESTQQIRRHYFRHAPAVLILILLNAAAFLFEISFGDWNDPDVLHRIGALEPYAVVVQGEYWRLFTALFLHGVRASAFQSFCALRSRSAAGAIDRRGAIRPMLFDFRTCLERGRCRAYCSGSRARGSACRRVGMHHGHRRRVGRIFAKTSSCAARETAPGKYLDDRRDSNSVRSFDAAGQHGSASLRIDRGFLSWAYPCAATCSRTGRPRPGLSNTTIRGKLAR